MPSLRFMLFSAVLILALYGLASAQTTQPAETGAAGRGGKMPQVQRFESALAKLNLSDDQKQQVDAAKQEFAEQVRDQAKSLKGASADDRKQQLKPMVTDFRTKLQDILTPQQMKDLRADMVAARQDKTDAKPSGRKPLADLKRDNAADGDGPMVRRVRDALATVGLSDDQKAKTDAILDDANTQLKALRGATTEGATTEPAGREKAGPVLKTWPRSWAAC